MRALGGLAFVLFAAAARDSAAATDEDGKPDAVPYRPTVSTPAALTAPGWL